MNATIFSKIIRKEIPTEWNDRLHALILIGIACVFAVGIAPVRSQEQSEAEEAQIEEVQPVPTGETQTTTTAEGADIPVDELQLLIKLLNLEELQNEAAGWMLVPTGNPQVATTTEEVDIPVDELELIVKPLTLRELQNEAAGWMSLLKAKAQEISRAEVAIKRKNLAIAKEKEGVQALKEAEKALEEAEEVLKETPPGSPEYEEATKKVEETKENVKKAQEAVEKAQTIKEELTEDKTLQTTLEKAQGTGDLDQAQQILNETNKARDQMVVGSPNYEKATETIEKIEAAIKAVEDAQEAQKGAQPNSPEYQEATQQLDEAQGSLKKLLEELGVGTTEQSIQQSSQELDQATAALENPKTQQQLEGTTEQLEEIAEAASEVKNQIIITATELQAQQTAIIDRFNVVLDELEQKGGRVEPYRRYIQGVSSVEVDVRDSEGLGLRLLAWTRSEEGGLRWAKNTGNFLGVFITSIIISQILGTSVDWLLSKFGASMLLRRFIAILVKRGGILVGFLLALTALEVSLGPVLALFGGVSFVLAFALQSSLGNLASGLMIMAYKPFDVGDEIKVGGLWGTVDSITLANTRIKGFGGQLFTVPNNAVWSDTIENLSNSEIRQIKIWLRVSVDEDLARVEQVLVDLFKSHPKVLEKPTPGTLVWEIADCDISMYVEGWVKKEDFWTVHPDVIRMIQERFAKEGLTLAANASLG